MCSVRVLILSKACIVGQYQTKLVALARHPGLELTVVVPPFWRDERGIIPLECAFTDGYTLRVEPMTLNGHFHAHFYPTLPNVIAEVRPDVVHIDEEPYNLASYLALRAALGVHARTVLFTWQNILRHYPPPFSWFETYALRRCDYMIAGNGQASEVLRGKGYSGPLSIIPQFGVDPALFVPSVDEKPSGAPFRIGFIGRFVEEKGAGVLLSAVAGLEGNWELHLLGSGPLRDRLQAQAVKLGIPNRVCFDTPRASVDMPGYFRTLDLFVLPSRTRPNWKEQFGRVLVEAMACAVPVIGSDCGEIPNVIGDAGLLFPEDDSEALRAHISVLYRDATRRQAMGERGRRRVLEYFTQERIAGDTYAVYQKVAA